MRAAARMLAAPAVVLMFGAAGSARADEPLWELGAGAAALRVPHYRGSDQSHGWLLPTPYFVYRGAIFKSDRDGTRAVLMDTERFDFDLSLGASPPASSQGNRAREGMPDLHATLEFGPKLNVLLLRGPGYKLDLRLPVRAAFSVERHPQALGWTFEPVLNLDVKAGRWNLGLQGGPVAATRKYHAYFYSVDPAYATPERPAYRAGGGRGGFVATASASGRVGDFWLGAYLRHDSVAGAVFEASPLVKQRSTLSAGVALSWIFKVSETRVPDAR